MTVTNAPCAVVKEFVVLTLCKLLTQRIGVVLTHARAHTHTRAHNACNCNKHVNCISAIGAILPYFLSGASWSQEQLEHGCCSNTGQRTTGVRDRDLHQLVPDLAFSVKKLLQEAHVLYISARANAIALSRFFNSARIKRNLFTFNIKVYQLNVTQFCSVLALSTHSSSSLLILTIQSYIAN